MEGNDDLKESNRRFDKQREEFEELLADVKVKKYFLVFNMSDHRDD